MSGPSGWLVDPLGQTGGPEVLGTVYVVIVEDRHVDVDVEVWTRREDAVKRADSVVKDNARAPGDIEYHEINDAMQRDRWIWYATYSPESDTVRVLERDVRG